MNRKEMIERTIRLMVNCHDNEIKIELVELMLKHLSDSALLTVTDEVDSALAGYLTHKDINK